MSQIFIPVCLVFHDHLPSVLWYCWLGSKKSIWPVKKYRNMGQCPAWWSPCRTYVAPSIQRHKVWLTPTTRCRAVTLPRRESSWNLVGCSKLTKRSQPLVGWSSPYSCDVWRIYCCLTSFFPIVDTCLSCEDIAWQSCAMVPRWRFLATFLRPVFSASRVHHVSDLHSKFTLGPHHVWKYGRHPTSDRWD